MSHIVDQFYSFTIFPVFFLLTTFHSLSFYSLIEELNLYRGSLFFSTFISLDDGIGMLLSWSLFFCSHSFNTWSRWCWRAYFRIKYEYILQTHSTFSCCIRYSEFAINFTYFWCWIFGIAYRVLQKSFSFMIGKLIASPQTQSLAIMWLIFDNKEMSMHILWTEIYDRWDLP